MIVFKLGDKVTYTGLYHVLKDCSLGVVVGIDPLSKATHLVDFGIETVWCSPGNLILTDTFSSLGDDDEDCI